VSNRGLVVPVDGRRMISTGVGAGESEHRAAHRVS
jgi:hypothetical protein